VYGVRRLWLMSWIRTACPIKTSYYNLPSKFICWQTCLRSVCLNGILGHQWIYARPWTFLSLNAASDASRTILRLSSKIPTLQIFDAMRFISSAQKKISPSAIAVWHANAVSHAALALPRHSPNVRLIAWNRQAWLVHLSVTNLSATNLSTTGLPVDAQTQLSRGLLRYSMNATWKPKTIHCRKTALRNIPDIPYVLRVAIEFLEPKSRSQEYSWCSQAKWPTASRKKINNRVYVAKI